MISVFEYIFFWPSVGRFLKSQFRIKLIDSESIVIVDVGINRGQSTTKFLKWFPKARIYAFEPLPSAFTLAKRRLAAHVHLYNLGVSSMSGVQDFWVSKLDETSTFNLPDLESNYHKMKSKILLSSADKIYQTLPVNTITLNEFAFEEKIGRIDLLKIDTEGHEFDVLKGATNLLKMQEIDLIQIERQETGLRKTNGALKASENVEKLLNAFSYFKVKTVSHYFAKIYDDFYMAKPE